MKVLNLRCSLLHSFEGWFGSEGEFQSQLSRSMVECPICADTHIQKMPSAPRLNLGSSTLPAAPGAPGDQAANSHNIAQASGSAGESHSEALTASAATPSVEHAIGKLGPEQQAAFFKAVREVFKKTEDVGERFAEEARRMHYGEVEVRGIRGQASAREAVALLEEGIEVMPLPMLPSLKETLQ